MSTDTEGIPVGASKSQNIILSEDGELRSIDAETEGESTSPDGHLSTVFCTNCGTANRTNSRFCRSCGQSLDEQAVDPASLDDYTPLARKSKRSADLATQAGHLTPQESAVMVEIFTLLILGVLGAISIATQQTWIAVVLLFIWLASKVARRGSSGGH